MINVNDIKKSIILVVDDSSQNIQLVGSLLKKAGFDRISFSTSGEHAIKMAETIFPDIILLDVMMPDMDGYEVCQKLKAHGNTKEIPIIFLTAKAYNEDIVKGLKLGAVDYITKPFDPEILLSKVKTHLEIKRQKDEIEFLNEKLIGRVHDEIVKRTVSENKLAAFYKQANYGITILDLNSQYVDINDNFAKMLGFAKDELVGKSAFDFIHEEDREIQKEAKKVLLEKGFVNFEKRLKKADGEYIWINASSTMVRDEINESAFIVTICADVMERHKLQEDIKEKEKMLFLQSKQAAMGNMIGMIAHQWKQPLSVISMAINNIKIDLELGELNINDLSTFIEDIVNNISYMDKTINDFRDFFKPNKMKTFSTIESICDESVKLVSSSMMNNNIELVKDYNINKGIDILGSELKQIILNLLSNAKDAVKLKKDDGKIKIQTYIKEENYAGNAWSRQGITRAP